MIRTIICSVFLHRYLSMLGKQWAAKVSFFSYLTIILLFDAFLAFDIFFNEAGITCDGTMDWQIYTLITVDSLQTIMLITIAY